MADIELGRAARALRALGPVEAIGRIVYLLAAPASAFAIVFEFLKPAPLSVKLALWAVLGVALMFVTLLGLAFAVMTMRPLIGAVFVALGAAPAARALALYLLSGDSLQDVLFFSGLALVLAAPLLWAAFRIAQLSPMEKAMARPAARIGSPVALCRETFAVWPGLRRGLRTALLATTLAHAGSVIGMLAWLCLTPLAVLLLALAPLFISKDGPLTTGLGALALVGAAWAASALQASLKAGARRLSRASFAEQVERDGRPPLLFLRSFQDDQVTLPERGRVAGVFRAVFQLGFGRRRLDHILVERFSRYGPSLALGKPGEKDLPFGAARIYPSHDVWQEVVAEVAGRARAVILVADRTPGVEWEVRTFLDGPWRAKTLFVCAPKSGDVRANPILAARLEAEGVAQGGPPILAAFWAPDGGLRTLRASKPQGPQAFLVALQAFFRREG